MIKTANPRATAAYPSPPHSLTPPGRRGSFFSAHDKRGMSSSLSPPHHQGPGNGPGPSDGSDRGPLGSLNLNFLKSLNDKRTTRDGQPQKRRGPKPDTKPALTRRQELNRQAQRTHRERKELYIKALEDEVLRLKEVYSAVTSDKDRLAEENRQLKQLLTSNGISMGGLLQPGRSSMHDDNASIPSVGHHSSLSISGSGTSFTGQPASSHTSAFTPPPLSAGTLQGQPQPQFSPQYSQKLSPKQSLHSNHTHSHSHGQEHGSHAASNVPQRNPGIDYDQAGIDFVLSLEKPCMDHLPWLVERGSANGTGEACGHALMASCPPRTFGELTPQVPFGKTHVKRGGDLPPSDFNPKGYTQQTWELSKGDLSTLLDLSTKLNLDGEITPVMAWGMVLAHPRLGELAPADFQRLTEELVGKVRCYGFGAVMEEFEVRDALESVYSTKTDMLQPGPNDVAMAY